MSNKGRTVLVVEDEQPLTKVIQDKLESQNFEAVTARTADQAIEYLGEMDNIDVIWLDHYLLGGKDGLDFVNAVKKDGAKHKGTPIFVVSNTATEEKVRSYLRLGVEKYYTKADHTLDDIVSDISEYLNGEMD